VYDKRVESLGSKGYKFPDVLTPSAQLGGWYLGGGGGGAGSPDPSGGGGGVGSGGW